MPKTPQDLDSHRIVVYGDAHAAGGEPEWLLAAGKPSARAAADSR